LVDRTQKRRFLAKSAQRKLLILLVGARLVSLWLIYPPDFGRGICQPLADLNAPKAHKQARGLQASLEDCFIRL